MSLLNTKRPRSCTPTSDHKPGTTLRARPQNPRVWSEPPPESAIVVAQRMGGYSPKLGVRRLEERDVNVVLPRALAISGLEHAVSLCSR